MLAPALDVSWGGYTITLTAIFGICTMVQWSDQWDFFINLSASDFPLLPQVKTNDSCKSRVWASPCRLRQTRNDTVFYCTATTPPPVREVVIVSVGLILAKGFPLHGVLQCNIWSALNHINFVSCLPIRLKAARKLYMHAHLTFPCTQAVCTR